MLKINSIFQSISGEAGVNIQQGTWTTFIRLQGCNLSCSYCDTKETQSLKNPYKKLSAGDIINRINELSIHTENILITGGEPLLQKKELEPLVHKLLAHNYKIQIETNGTILLPDWDVGWVVDYKFDALFAPFEKEINQYKNIAIKFVVGTSIQVETAMVVIRGLVLKGFTGNFIISPIIHFHGKIIYNRVDPLRHALSINSHLMHRIIISVQTHKILNLA